MNPRIRELMESCFDITIDSRGREDCSADYINVQRFAELIVQDCVTKCDEVQAMYGQYTFTARKCKEAITEHFGVEE